MIGVWGNSLATGVKSPNWIFGYETSVLVSPRRIRARRMSRTLVTTFRKMQWHTFNILLIALSVYDIVFLLCSLVVYAVPAIEIQSILDLTQTWAFAHVYKAVFYPFTTIAYSGGVYLTTAITVERYGMND